MLLYAYPHHLNTFGQQNADIQYTGVKLQSATKGEMEAIVASNNKWILTEPELSSVSWLPKHPEADPSAVHEIMEVIEQDISKDYASETLLTDNYFSGKGLQKFAMIALLLNQPDKTHLQNPEMAATSLEKLKQAFIPYLENRQNDPFRYDSVYKGVVAMAGLPESMGGSGDVNAAFGHSYYNDHHYHNGYLIVTGKNYVYIYALFLFFLAKSWLNCLMLTLRNNKIIAAVIHYLDPSWRSADLIEWTEALIRDVNTAVDDDPNFAPFRSWDWYAGHSWAGGIKVNGALDGRDQESIPEV